MMIFRRRVPHVQQDYNTVGNWEIPSSDEMFITVSQLSNPRYELLIALHEQIEADLCQAAGIDEEDVTAFDIAYEESRRLKLPTAPCGCKHWDEPGNDVHAPYYEQHHVATQCEQLIGRALGVEWEKYEKEIEKLEYPSARKSNPGKAPARP